jgi:hypothetical protein
MSELDDPYAGPAGVGLADSAWSARPLPPGNFVTIVTRLGISIAIATAFQVRDRELDLAPRSVGWRVKPRPPQMCRCSHRASAASWHSCWIGTRYRVASLAACPPTCSRSRGLSRG